MRSLLIRSLVCSSLLLITLGAASQENDLFAGRTITYVVPNPPGGGNDFLGRLLGPLLTEELPGNPEVIVRNMPGASGVIAANRFVQLAESGELVLMGGAPLQIDPLNFRRSQAEYDPAEFNFLGGFTLGGAALVISKDAKKRLYDDTLPPVVMGSLAGRTRTSMIMAGWGAELLDWNMKWVSGYRGGESLVLALQRGEVDMTALSSTFLMQDLVESGDFEVIVQSGLLKDGEVVPRPILEDVPVLADLVEDQIDTPIEEKAFAYWLNLRTLEKWVAAPPETSEEVLAAYRSAYEKIIQSKEFVEASTKISDSLSPIPHQEFTKRVQELSNTTPEVIDYVFDMLRGQGLKISDQ